MSDSASRDEIADELDDRARFGDVEAASIWLAWTTASVAHRCVPGWRRQLILGAVPAAAVLMFLGTQPLLAVFGAAVIMSALWGLLLAWQYQRLRPVLTMLVAAFGRRNTAALANVFVGRFEPMPAHKLLAWTASRIELQPIDMDCSDGHQPGCMHWLLDPTAFQPG